jgi:hypothetical protein
MGRAADQNVNDSSEFTVIGNHRIEHDRQPAAWPAPSVHSSNSVSAGSGYVLVPMVVEGDSC